MKTGYSLAGIAFTLPKKAESAVDCQDAIAWDLGKQIFGVADGVGTSFLAGAWASALVRGFVESPPIQNDFTHWRRVAGESWSERLAETAERGDLFTRRRIRQKEAGCATFVGASLQAAATDAVRVDLWACGDACALLIEPEGRCIESFPLTEPSQFDDAPAHLSSSDPDFNEKLRHRVLHVREQQILVLATDAVAKWMLRVAAKEPCRLQSLLRAGGPAQFAKLITKERDCTDFVLENDDVALLVLAPSAQPSTILDYRAIACDSSAPVCIETSAPLRKNPGFSPKLDVDRAIEQPQAQAKIVRSRSRYLLVAAAPVVMILLASVAVLAAYFHSARQHLDRLQLQVTHLNNEMARNGVAVTNFILEQLDLLRHDVPDRAQVQAVFATGRSATSKTLEVQSARLESLETDVSRVKESLYHMGETQEKDSRVRNAADEDFKKELRHLMVLVQDLDKECRRLKSKVWELERPAD